MPIKSYVQPTPPPKDIIQPRRPKVIPTEKQAPMEFAGPTLEQWTEAGYDPARYPGEDAFMRAAQPQPEQVHHDDAGFEQLPEQHDEEHHE